MLETAALVALEPSPEARLVGLYVLVAIAVLLVCGLISIARELRAEASARS